MATNGQDHNYKKVELAGSAVDEFSGTLGVITELHLMAHRGYMFHASGKQTGLIDTGTAEFVLAVPANTYPHFARVRLNFGDGDIDVETFKNTVTSALGAAHTANNTNQNSLNTPGMTLHGAATITDIGDPLHVLWAPPSGSGGGGGGGNPNASTIGISDITNGEEWILEPSTQYGMRVTNDSGGTISYSYEFLWYEIGATP